MRVKGVKIVTVRKRGRVFRYFYHRATGKRIAADWDTAAFAAEVERLDAAAKEQAPRDGSLTALIVAYKKSPEFTHLAPRTQRDYQKVFDWLATIGNMALLEMDTAFIYSLRDKAFKQRKRRFANYVVQVARLVLTWGKPRNFLEVNPATEIESIPRPKKMRRANPPWHDDEREAVLAAAPIQLRSMIALAMFAGLREGDACAALLSAYDGKLIETIAAKNAEPLWISAHFRLRQILEETATWRKAQNKRRARRRKVLPIDPPTLCVTSRGKPWTESGFRASFFGLMGKLAKKGAVRPGLTYHGLRHTLGKLVIEAGGAKEDVAMILGDRSMAMAEFYSREHEKKGRVAATIIRLEQTERAKMENRADANGKPALGSK